MRNGIHFIRGRQWIALAALFLLCTVLADAETITYNFSIDDFEITRENGVTFVKSRDPLVSYGEQGRANLPVLGKHILCPYRKDVLSWAVSCEKILIGTDVRLPVNAALIPDSMTNGRPYNVPELKICTVSQDVGVSMNEGMSGKRGFGYKTVSISPFEYDYEAKKLYLYTSITLDIDWRDCPTWSISPRTEPSDSVRHILDIPELDESNTVEARRSSYPDPIYVDDKIDYMIITVDSLRPALQDLLVWRRSLGLKAEIVSVEDINRSITGDMDLPLKIKTFLCDAYVNNCLEYVTLVGNTRQVPTRYCYCTVQGGYNHASVPTDMYYSTFDGDLSWGIDKHDSLGNYNMDLVDWLPDAVVSRIPAANSHEISDVIRKIIEHERYFDHAVQAPKVLYAGGHCYKYVGEMSDAHVVAMESAGTIASHGILYDFIFDTGSTIDTSEGEYTAFNDALQSGYEMVSVQTHGQVGTWEEPFWFGIADAGLLRNSHSSVVLTAACSTASFDNDSGCLGSTLLLNPSGGCVAYIGSSRYSFYPFTAEDGIVYYSPRLVNGMISDWSSLTNHSIGNAFLNSKLNSLHWSDDRHRWLFFSNCMLGDSFQISYSGLPETLDFQPIYKDGRLSLKPKANGISANIASYIITDIDGDNYCKRKIDDLEDIPLVSSYFTICITRENSLPYIATVSVIRDSVITTSVEINADLILAGPNLQIRDGGDLRLRGTEIVLAPGILVESGGNFNIDSSGND